MAGGWWWSRRGAMRARTLRGLLRDTQRALADVADILPVDPELIATVQTLSQASSRRTVLVLLGEGRAAQARLLHCLLGRRVLPDAPPRGMRWLRVQYGSCTQVHLSLGNSEFELVEDLECNKAPWDTLPLEDLMRKDESELTTVLELEINNHFLKDGLSIIIPPDLPTEPDPSNNYSNLKQMYPGFYAKRDQILRNFNPVYLYAVDRIGKNVFADNFCDNKIVTSRSDEDFWSTFNLYYMTRSMKENDSDRSDSKVKSVSERTGGQPAVFDAENCLDLHQVKELNPNAQIFFVLFSDSVEMAEREARATDRDGDTAFSEATESTEHFRDEELPECEQGLLAGQTDGAVNSTWDKRRQLEEQCAFMNDLLDQWELMSSPPAKHSVKSQWLIIDDKEILSTCDQKNLAANPSKTQPDISETSLKGGSKGKRDEDRVVKSRTILLSKVVKFASDTFQTYLLEYSTKLSEVHVKLLQQFILSSFDLARELQVVPKKIQFVAKQEQQLYETMNEKFSEGDKKKELLQIMQEVLQEMRVEVNNMDWSVDDLPYHQDKRFMMSNSVFYDGGASARLSQNLPNRQKTQNKNDPDMSQLNETPVEAYKIDNEQLKGQSNKTEQGSIGLDNDESSDVEEAVSYDSYNFDDYDIIESNDESFGVSECFRRRFDGMNLEETASGSESQIGLIHVENESSLLSVNSTLHRLIDSNTSKCTNNTQISVKQASLDVQKNVLSKLSRRISMKLVDFVDCLKDSYFGTLQRCLESLEAYSPETTGGGGAGGAGGAGGRPASAAMRQLARATRAVELRPTEAFSLLRCLLHAVRRLFHRLRLAGGGSETACCVLSPAWRRQVALHALASLTAQRLARLICDQILERLSTAHERYQSALASLEAALANRLHHSEDVKLAIRKKYAPSFARLCLESTSMCDLLMYGAPDLGREIGRGQYGVVYRSRGGWAGRAAAVKSVLPADERHYHELAMEFFYTRCIPAHPRIVRLYGSIVSRQQGGGGAGGVPAVCLVMSLRSRDLHSAVRVGLPTRTGLAIARDIVQGIRYLHSLGLVHRDIKMKNVLLDQNDRASLTDLGFCAAEALMSGSVVGTPVHMAPELLSGEYDAAVDVYAFAILFWYVCAGSVKLPSAFEVFQNKEQLWSKVRKGLRPERLPHFTQECWDIMQACWAPDPARRAHLGDIQPRLDRLIDQCDREPTVAAESRRPDLSDDDSVDVIGLKAETHY